MNINDLKDKLSRTINRRLDAERELSCEDMYRLAQAISELERNDLFKAMTSLGTMSGFGGERR